MLGESVCYTWYNSCFFPGVGIVSYVAHNSDIQKSMFYFMLSTQFA